MIDKDEVPVIEKGIPIPSQYANRGSRKALVQSLEIGDSFVDMYARRSILVSYAKSKGYKLAFRRIDGEGREGTARIWRVS